MSESNKNKLHSLLFEEGRVLENIKFFPGDSRGLNADMMAGEAAESIRRVLNGEGVAQAPSTGAVKCKLAAFA